MLQRIGLAAPILRWGAENPNEVLNCFFCFHHSLEVNFRWVQTKKPLLTQRLRLDFRREDRIRTCDPVVPNHVFYRAELPPETLYKKVLYPIPILKGGKGNGIRRNSKKELIFLLKTFSQNNYCPTRTLLLYTSLSFTYTFK